VEDRLTELRRLGIGKELAAQTAGSRKRYWHISRSPALSMALTRAHLIQLGLPLLLEPEPNV
jgi:RNA-directed DNA polymerase